MKRKLKEFKGITLIALVITIIVMIILVAVTVTVALQGGLFTTAKTATGKTQLEKDKELLMAAAVGALGEDGTYTKDGNTFIVDEYGGVTVSTTGNSGANYGTLTKSWDISENQDESVIMNYYGDTKTAVVSGSGSTGDMLSFVYLIGAESISEVDEDFWDSHRNQETDDFIFDYPIETLIVENGITKIGAYSFLGCKELTSINIANSVTSIGSYAFDDCTAINEIILSDNVTDVSKSTFEDTAYYKNNDNWENDVLYIGKHLIACNINKEGEYSIKEGTKTIGEVAFSHCTKLTNIVMPDSVTTIGNSSFSYCEELADITFSNGLINIGNRAFEHCAFTTITIPNGVENIPQSAFYACRKLTSITIPDSVKTIGSSAFDACYKLENVTIGNSVTTIGSYAFCGCTKLNNIALSESLTSLGSQAFEGCYGLTVIRIPNNVTSISGGVFKNCNNLETIYIPASVTSIDKYVFYNIKDGSTIYCETQSVANLLNENNYGKNTSTVIVDASKFN